MNLYVILLIVHLFEEFGCVSYVENSVQYLTTGDESQEKLEQLERVGKELMKDILYRNSQEEPARIKATKRIHEFEDFTNTPIHEIKEAPEETKSKKLWKRAKEASANYQEIKRRFEHEKFCDRPMADGVCSRAFKDPFFQKEKLTYDIVKSVNNDGCFVVPYSLRLVDGNRVDFMLGNKSCLARKRNDDGTEVSIKVYLQSAYVQPLIGKYKYFVILKYIKNPETGRWERPPSYEKIYDNALFRYEAYLSLN